MRAVGQLHELLGALAECYNTLLACASWFQSTAELWLISASQAADEGRKGNFPGVFPYVYIENTFKNPLIFIFIGMHDF